MASPFFFIKKKDETLCTIYKEYIRLFRAAPSSKTSYRLATRSRTHHWHGMPAIKRNSMNGKFISQHEVGDGDFNAPTLHFFYLGRTRFVVTLWTIRIIGTYCPYGRTVMILQTAHKKDCWMQAQRDVDGGLLLGYFQLTSWQFI